MEIREYREHFKNQIIALILYIQNFDTHVSLSLEDQPDLNDIENCYLKGGGGFRVAVDDGGDVVGTLGLVRKDKSLSLNKPNRPDLRRNAIRLPAEIADTSSIVNFIRLRD